MLRPYQGGVCLAVRPDVSYHLLIDPQGSISANGKFSMKDKLIRTIWIISFENFARLFFSLRNLPANS
jgi:hypothetical protein